MDWTMIAILLIVTCWLWLPMLIGLVAVIFEGLASVARGIRGVPEPSKEEE